MKPISVKFKMSKNLITVKWNDPMGEAYALMEEYRIRHLPVLDAEGIVIGILSDRDVHHAMNPKRNGFIPDCQVADFMSWPAITVDENSTLKAVAEGMVDEKISALLVTSKGDRVVGIVTSEDLLRFLASSFRPSEESTLANIKYSPLVGEILREAQAAGL